MGRSGDTKLLLLAATVASLLVAPATNNVALAQTSSYSDHRPRWRGTLPLTPFYDTPVPLPSGGPGDLIRSQPFDEYDLPTGVSAVRILYHSVSARGEDVAASGVVLIPNKTPPPAGWPVIAWAHRFMATARPCAPSLSRALNNGPFLSMYANLGYAVVATDYVGLGSDFRNAFVDLQSNATDVIYSVQAARQALRQLSSKWVAMVDGEGGAAALAVAELQGYKPDPNYLGSVAVSGAIDLKAEIGRLSERDWQDGFAYLAYGIKTVYPQFPLEDMLTPKGLARYTAVNQTCSAPLPSPTPALSDMLKSGWQGNPFIRNFLERNTLGLRPTPVPLLIVNAEDSQAADSMAFRVVARMCAQGDHIDFERYSGNETSGLIGASVATQISWIKARFAGQKAPNNCPEEFRISD